MNKITITKNSDKKSGIVDLPGGGQSLFVNDDDLLAILEEQKKEYQQVVDDIDKNIAAIIRK